MVIRLQGEGEILIAVERISLIVVCDVNNQKHVTVVTDGYAHKFSAEPAVAQTLVQKWLEFRERMGSL